MTEDHRAIVYDLDGTLARLDVDWAACARTVIDVYGEAGVEMDGEDLWTMLEVADDHDLGADVERAIADHERAGARRSTRLPRADDLRDHPVPVGVCSLNCEAACRIALERHDLLAHVDAIVGRDTVAEWKPNPEPLLATVERLDAAVVPDAALFVGDSERDRTTARRAGMPYEWAYDGGPTRR